MTTVATAALSVSHLSKAYAGTLALDDVDLDIRPGEVHTLWRQRLRQVHLDQVPRRGGDAGAGRLDRGGRRRGRRGVVERRPGVRRRFVHQQPAVFPELSIAENIAFGSGFPRARSGGIGWKALHDRTRGLLTTFGVEAEPTTPLGDLRAADRTRVAIIRAVLDREDATSGVLVLDEPTAALPAAEVDHLLASLRRYAAAGQTILYVSHRLDEVLSVADRVTVLRDGRKVDTVEARGLTETDLVELIVGRPLDRLFPEVAEVAEDVVLRARHLAGGPLTDVSFDLHAGEVLGVAGLLGSGRSELLRSLFGAHALTSG